MTRTTIKKLALVGSLASFASAAPFAQPSASSVSSERAVSSAELGAIDAGAAPYVIFSNLSRETDSTYNSHIGFNITGKDAGGFPELSYAVLFVPKVEVKAKVLAAAITYVSGTKLVKLGLYSDDPDRGSVGDLLPGGEGSTTVIPDDGTCCDLATVTLAGDGVVLSAGTRYWLVASADNVNGPSFNGFWQLSLQASYAGLLPPAPWGLGAGQWPAAQIRGTRTETLSPGTADLPELTSPAVEGRDGKVTVFTNLDRNLPYGAGSGYLLSGNKAQFAPEIWLALPFKAKANLHAKTLAAAIAYTSGTKKVNLGLYSDDAGLPGTLLPDGQGSTTDIPTSGQCCELARVTLPGPGVALTAGTQYWLVASPDNIEAPDFKGIWQVSSLAVSAYEQPEQLINWTSFSAGWMAAEIRGTNP